MKRILCAVGALMMCATPLFAVGAKDKEKTEFDRHWFMQVQAGAAYTLGETGFGDLLSPAAALSAGYRFSPVWGLRFGLGGWQAKGAWVSPEMHYKFNYLQGNVEAMLDLANLFGRFNPVRTVNPYLSAGSGSAGRSTTTRPTRSATRDTRWRTSGPAARFSWRDAWVRD